MKKLFLFLLFFAATNVTMAQVEKVDDRLENNLDQIEQEPRLPAQVDLERKTRIESQRVENEKRVEKRDEKLDWQKSKLDTIAKQ